MVVLTMNAAIVAALEDYNALQDPQKPAQLPGEPSLESPQLDNPITYGQLLDLSIYMQQHGEDDKLSKYELGTLLQGSQVKSSPRKLDRKTEGSDYQKLMARLRRQEEEREYKKMTSAPPEFPPAQPEISPEDEKDEMTYSDVNRQMTLIINVIVSIVACGIGVWLVARHFSTPQRVALSMTGGGVVGVAEVAVYFGYIRRLTEAKSKETAKTESRFISESWVIEARPTKEPLSVEPTGDVQAKDEGSVRLRKGKRR
ncbi:MAG: hypothetical protein M1828_003468 [Chrysothrix sp. TS-e1954]|nr:MAG: hypothetical protein M1828_003468 [Chrysothrix sp. TS-e1954]